MKLYYIKSKLKRFRPLGLILSEYLKLDLNIIDEKEIVKIIKKPDIVYCEFSMNYDLSNKCFLIGPNKDIVSKWNNKIYQYDNLKDIIRVPIYESYKNILKLIKDIDYIKKKFKKFIIFNSIGDSGNDCLVCDEKTLSSEIFNKFKNSKNNFRVSKFIPDVHNVSLHFIIAKKNKFWISPIADQFIEKEILFKGGSYPSTISNQLKSKVYESANMISEVLSKDGYIGLGHVDFMISNNEVYFTEINPRKASTTPYISYVMENCFNYSIPIIEYYAVKERIILDVKRLKKDISWSLKLIPYTTNVNHIPGEERSYFKKRKNSEIIYNEFYSKHTFKVKINNENSKRLSNM